MALELEASRLLKLTLIPLGVGATMLGVGAALADGITVPHGVGSPLAARGASVLLGWGLHVVRGVDA